MLCSRFLACAATSLLIGLTGCSLFGVGGSDNTAMPPPSGYVVSDEPLASQIGANILSQGGSAADAATAMYFALSATYPVAAGLGGGGICVVHDPQTSQNSALSFLARKAASGGMFGVPGNVRGFGLLQQSFGRIPWQRDVSAGEGLATTGFPISKALETRLLASQNAIRLDANLAAEFLDESGLVKPVGTQVGNPELGATLTAIRANGSIAFYQGTVAQKLVAYSATEGGAIQADELAGYPVDSDSPAARNIAGETVYLPPTKLGSGSYENALLGRVVDPQGQIAASANPAAAVASATKATLDQFRISSLPRDMGATGFAALDNTGQAVACAVTLNGAFGSGHTADGTGIVLANAPSGQGVGLSGAFLSPTVAISADGATLALAAVGAGGPNGTASVADALLDTALGRDLVHGDHLRTTGLAPFDTINAIACYGGGCAALPDPGASGSGAVAP